MDLEFELHFGKYHDVDSSQDAFYLCALEAFRDAETQAGITLLEPIMKVVVVCPKQYQGSISGDINRRRGMIEETSEDKGIAQVMAKIPLANLFGYTNDLRSATAGHRELLDGVQPLRRRPRGAGGPAEEGREEEIAPGLPGIRRTTGSRLSPRFSF